MAVSVWMVVGVAGMMVFMSVLMQVCMVVFIV
jgi:hypothetical protein